MFVEEARGSSTGPGPSRVLGRRVQARPRGLGLICLLLLSLGLPGQAVGSDGRSVWSRQVDDSGTTYGDLVILGRDDAEAAPAELPLPAPALAVCLGLGFAFMVKRRISQR